MARDPLSLYRNASRYDRLTEMLVAGMGDEEFYRAQARQAGGAVLELACGTGRLAIPLAQSGFEVTGIDLSTEMLALAKRKARALSCTVEWVEADIRRFNIERRYALIFIAHNSFAHVTTRCDVEEALASIRRHMTPEGRFIVDVFNPSLAILTRDPDRDYPVTEYDDLELGGRVIMTQRNRYDAASQVNFIEWKFAASDGSGDTITLDARIFFPQELDALLEYNGLAIEQKYGWYDGSPFESGSPKQIVVCRLKGS